MSFNDLINVHYNILVIVSEEVYRVHGLDGGQLGVELLGHRPRHLAHHARTSWLPRHQRPGV